VGETLVTVLSVTVGMTVVDVGVPGISLLRFPEPAFDWVFMVHPQANTSKTTTDITKTGNVSFTGSLSFVWGVRGV
jgi:hypothetical protein